MSNIEGKFSLHQAAKAGEVEIVKDLLAKGADKNEKNDEGWTPLIEAVVANHLGVVQCLVEQDVEKDKANNDGATALMYAAQEGHIEVLRYLVEQGVECIRQCIYIYISTTTTIICFTSVITYIG